MLSQVSRVSAVRTMRALLRAVSIDDITLDGLPVSRSRKSETVATVNSECRAWNASSAPALTTTEVHSSAALSLLVSAMRKPGIEQARHVLRPLDVAVHPVEAVGGATEQHSGSVANGGE